MERPRPAALLFTIGLLLAAMPAAAVVASVPQGAKDNTAEGTELVERFFDLLVDGDIGEMAKLLSPAFQLQGADGGFLTEDEFLQSPPEIESYEIDNIQVTRAGNVLVARYDVTAVVTIDGVAQSRDPAPRLSVFMKVKKRWQMVAHANFNVPAEEPQR